MQTIQIHTATIELYKLLKLAGLSASGGDAKAAIADGQVMVNGQTETRKRKQTAPGDVVEYDQQQCLVAAEGR
jgi:ribosome-associated protein